MRTFIVFSIWFYAVNTLTLMIFGVMFLFRGETSKTADLAGAFGSSLSAWSLAVIASGLLKELESKKKI